MSGFVARWARRKAAAQSPEAPPSPVEAPVLPPVEALDAASDFTAFLQAGVAATIQSSALRVAWETDPRIADFRGMAEYDWDFNAVGYGRLAPGDSVTALLQRLLAQPAASKSTEPGPPAIGSDVRPPPPRTPTATYPDSRDQVAAPVPDAEPLGVRAVALEDPSETPAAGAPRRHGGALPS